MDLTLLLAFALAALLISLVPGPDMLYIIAQGVTAGPRAGFLAALGMSSGLAVHSIAAALGLSAIFQVAPMAMDILRIFGVVFLAYLAYKTFRAPLVLPADDGTVAPKSLGRVYTMAVLTNVANPKIILFYLVFLPQFIAPTAAWPVPVQFLALGVVFILVGLVVDGTAGLASGALSTALRRRQRVQRWLNRVCASVFGLLALHLATDRP